MSFRTQVRKLKLVARIEPERIKNNRNRLFDLHKKLRQLTFFDPACGNFLMIAYRELRLLELAVLRASRDPASNPSPFR